MSLDNKTQLFRPLITPRDNLSSYYKYCWKNNPGWERILKVAMFVISSVSLILDITSTLTANTFVKLLFVAGIIGPLIVSIVEFSRNYNKRFTVVEVVPGAFEDVLPPDDGWKRRELILPKAQFMNDSTIEARKDEMTPEEYLRELKKSPTNDLEVLFVCEDIDIWLRSGQHVGLVRDTGYEKNLRKKIENKDRWEGIYKPFLDNNHRDAMFRGKQFYNETKWGLSAEIYPGMKTAKAHKTCYFDTYLTNIIPGKTLKYSSTGETVAETFPELMPYHIDTYGHRHLHMLGEVITSNELGVTTLCILPNGYIRLWRQNLMAQCSTGLLVASGSGSADWDDAKRFIGHENGMREAIVYGMERELWEESNGGRENKDKFFKDMTDTRILGYFRWLKKGAKSEFVGVSRLTDVTLLGNLSPETSEVTRGEDLPARTIRELLGSIEKEMIHHPDGTGDEDFVENWQSIRCGVSCSMALIALHHTCELYCQQKCDCYDKELGCCNAEKCKKKPIKVLFEGEHVL